MIPKSYLRNIPPTAKGRARFLKLKEAKERDLRNIEDGISKDQAAISASTTAIASIEQTIAHSKTTLTTYRKNLDALISMRQNLQALEHDVGLGSDATEEPESLGVCNNVLQFINTSTTVENQPLDRQQSGLEDRINRLVAMKEELEHELSDWKLEKLLSESSLAHLKRYYEELNSVLDGYNVTLSARHHFPAEVWILIFQEWVIDRDSNFDHQSRPSPLILSHVCQEWRKVIRNAAILWKRVDIFPASWIPQGTMQYQKLVVQHGAHNTVEIIVDISRRWSWEAQANESAIAGRLYRPDRYRNSYLSSDSPNYCTDRSDLAQASSQTVTRPYSLVVRTKNADSQDLTRLGRIPFRSPFSLTLQSIQCISSPQLLPMIKLFEPIQKLNLDNISPQASTNPAISPPTIYRLSFSRRFRT
ncbi:hypothetical protein FRC19_003088 [Serendipita sp. 401]|nr:hypothetical protein FRC19_003088 [Serendipita sp. 401]